MDGRGKWMEIKRVSGRVIERATVFVPANTRERKRKDRRKGGTTALKQDENERQAEKRLARLINCNFRPGDLLLGPSFDEDHWQALRAQAEKLREKHPEETEENLLVMAAEHEGELWIQRLRRAAAKAGRREMLRYIAVTSDMDGETGQPKRVHLHVLVPSWAREFALKAWKAGSVDIQFLREQDDYTPVARYMLRQVRRRPDAKKWRAAQHMDQPVVTITDIPAEKILKPRKGEVIMHQNAIEPGQPQYLRTVDMGRKRPEIKRKVNGTRKKPKRGKERTL